MSVVKLARRVRFLVIPSLAVQTPTAGAILKNLMKLKALRIRSCRYG